MKIRLFKRLNLVPMALCALLALAVLGSLGYIYANGASALSSASYWEKYQMSIAIDPDEDYRHNESISPVYSCVDVKPVFRTSDGATVNGGVVSAPYYNLIGEQAGGKSRYLMDVYTDTGTFKAVYSPLTGIRSGTPIEPEVIELTVNSTLQETMYDYLTDNGVIGTVFCYDYTTGDILCSVSTPGCASDADMTELADGTLMNKCLYSTPPGSTMKTVTTLFLADAADDLDALTYTCTGSVEIEGQTIVCTGVHGEQNGAEAIGNSCNVWYAQAVYENLTVERVTEVLKSLGWSVNGSHAKASVGGVPVSPSRITLNTGGWDFTSIWALIGETTVEVSPSWMAELAAQYVTGCEAVSPRFRTDGAQTVNPMWSRYAEAMERSRESWRRGFTEIVSYDYPRTLTMGKTGTYEFEGGDEQKTYTGVSEDLGVSFYITMENYRRGGETLEVWQMDVARVLLNTIEEVRA